MWMIAGRLLEGVAASSKEPHLFADKPKKYVVQAVVLRSKAQRYAQLRHQRKIVYDADVNIVRNGSYLSMQQIDTRIDLQRVHISSKLRSPS
jgi:hypothetical protein